MWGVSPLGLIVAVEVEVFSRTMECLEFELKVRVRVEKL